MGSVSANDLGLALPVDTCVTCLLAKAYCIDLRTAAVCYDRGIARNGTTAVSIQQKPHPPTPLKLLVPAAPRWLFWLRHVIHNSFTDAGVCLGNRTLQATCTEECDDMASALRVAIGARLAPNASTFRSMGLFQ